MQISIYDEKATSRSEEFMVRGVLRVATRSVRRLGSNARPQTLSTQAAVLAPSERVKKRQYRQQVTAISAFGLAVAITVAATANDDSKTFLEAKQMAGNGLLTAAVGEEEEANVRPRVARRLLLKQRSKHQAKQEEVDQMKTHLDGYKQRRESIDSLRARFDMYASKSVVQSDGRSVKAMTFTDFLHSFVLPQFHLHKPRPDLVYSCDFVGDANGLITYEECYLLIHLLQIPKEHFNVAFCMFDLDGDGSVDKAEFCAVIGNLLRSITSREGGEEAITSTDLEVALDLLRKHILRAEFDLYATVNPVTREPTMSVHDFALTLVSCFDPEKLPPYLDRVQTLSASDGIVSWEDFFAFHFNVQGHLADIKLAFELTGIEEITEAEFIRAAHVVTGVELSSPVVQLAFRVFDDNANGTLDQSELFRVLETRNTVQLKQPTNLSLLKNLWHCIKSDDKL
ncbi:Calcium uptake protein 1, mitochondrial [Phytophthora boehmeriae]|uniref:Calcium uptake protein 1, mitochondrial n=1 Tax=Phytophthora boehmeriae TaxID=109152 RepID=A0A8T1WSB9_9STRA|nr:Calcium uptake protein 1, mitochondrial [Phytophthora boehmeriae]